MPPQNKFDLSRYSPEQQASIKQQLELALKAGSLNPAQRTSVEGILKTFPPPPDPSRNIPTSETREPEPTVLGTAGREGMAFLKAFPQAITGAYEAATAPKSKQEAKEYPTALDYPALLFNRMIDVPTDIAESWYTAAAKGQIPNAYEQALTAAPEAMGQGAAAPVMGKLTQIRSFGDVVNPQSILGRLLRTSGRTGLQMAQDVPVLRKLGKFAENYRATGDTQSIMQKLTRQAVAEGRASKLPTRIPEHPVPVPKKTTPPAVRYSTTREVEPTPREAAPPPVRYSTTRAAEEPAARKVTPPSVRYSTTGAPGAASEAAQAEAEGIKGSLPKGKGRMVLTPEEAKQLENFYRMNKKAAHERGMAFAGGRVPAEGRSVPQRPLPQTTVEWQGLKGEELADILRRLGVLK